MQQRDPVTLSIAVLLTVMIGLHLPTRDRLAEWIERQLVLLADERQAPRVGS